MAANPVIWRAALALCVLLVLLLAHDLVSHVLAMPTQYKSAEARTVLRPLALLPLPPLSPLPPPLPLLHPLALLPLP